MEGAPGWESGLLGPSTNFPTNSLCDLGQVPSLLWALVASAEPEEFGDDDPGSLLSWCAVSLSSCDLETPRDWAAPPQTLDEGHAHPSPFIQFQLQIQRANHREEKNSVWLPRACVRAKAHLLGSFQVLLHSFFNSFFYSMKLKNEFIHSFG